MSKPEKLIEPLMLSITAVFAPIKGLLITTAVMIAVDLITGIMAALKRQEKITSSGLRRTISKIFVYEVAIMMAYLAEHYISDILPFVKLVSAVVALVELKSILENLNTVNGDNSLKILVDKLGSTNATDTDKS